jgi:PAS domain S-box-containing protein
VTALLHGARSVLEHHQFQPTARALYEACKGLIGATAGYVAMLRGPSEDVDLLFLDSGGVSCTVDSDSPMPLRGLRAEAYRTQRVVYENDFPQSPHAPLLPHGHSPLANVLFAPLLLQGEVVGLLGLANKPGGFSENDARLAAAFADLTAVALDHSRTLQLLAESEEHFRLLAQSAEDAILTTDARGTITFWNPAAERIFGFPAAEILGQPLTRLMPERLHAAHRAAFDRALGRRKLELGQQTRETVGRHRDGREIAVDLSMALWRSGPRTFCTAIVRDITERKQAEEALRHARDELELRVNDRTQELRVANERLRQEIKAGQRKEKDLAEAELRYRTVADFTYDWEYWRTSDGGLLYCSPSCERVTGYSAPELVANPELLTTMVHPEEHGVWQQHVCDVTDEPGPRTILFRIQRKDGGIRWIEHSCQPVIGGEGKFLGARASNRDVTERKQAEIELQHLRQELARASQITTAGQLAAALAHELNQPLGAIVCNVQAAEQYLSQAPPALSELREILSDIEADGQRAGDVIHRLRALYQKTGQKRTALQVNKVIQETIELMQSEFVLKGVAVQLALEAALPLVSGDYIQLQQVVINLVANALDATAAQEPGARCLHIATACREPKTVRLSFRDSGTGLSAEQLSRVGEPFFTTKTTEHGNGAGDQLFDHGSPRRPVVGGRQPGPRRHVPSGPAGVLGQYGMNRSARVPLLTGLSINSCAPRYAAKRTRLLGVNGIGFCRKTPKNRSPRVGPVFSGAVSRGCFGENRQSLTKEGPWEVEVPRWKPPVVPLGKGDGSWALQPGFRRFRLSA